VGTGEVLGRGVRVALYDALKHVKAHPNIEAPPWILEGALKVVEDRLRAGFDTGRKPNKKNDERKIYKTEITAYYRWREVFKRHLAGDNIEQACNGASELLAAHKTFKGSPETMRKDYQRVSRDLKDPAKAYRYYSAMPETRDITGTRLVPKVETEN
jgi:hypothetical protein